MNRLKRSILSCLLLLPAVSYGERNLILYTQDSNGQKTADPYTERNTDINDSGRFVYAAGPEQNVMATHGTTTSLAIAYTDMLLKETNYVKSSEFNTIIEDEPNVDVSPDGRYLALRPSPTRADEYSSDAAPLYVYDVITEQLTPVIKSFDGSPLLGCSNQWKLHNWSRSSFAYLQGELIYHSSCSNIVEGDTNGVSDVFAYNMATGKNTRLTQVKNELGEWDQLNGGSVSPEVDDSGRFVAFASKAKNIALDENGQNCASSGYHVFVLDRKDGSYHRVTACDEGKLSESSVYFGISGDGSTVIAGGNSIYSAPPASTRLNIFDTQSKDKLAIYSYFRRGSISLSYDASRVAFISTAFYNFAGNYLADVSAHGTLEIWDRVENKHVSIADNYFDQSPVNTFHHDGSAISGGGDFVFFAGNSSQFWFESLRGENAYHEYVGNRFLRNYRYVTVRGDHNSWSSFSNMRLVNDNIWQAEITTHVANSPIKFDVSGDWSENYGDNNNDGLGDFAGANILIQGGPGHYRVTFNDSTKAYQVEPLEVPVLDGHLQPAGVDVSFECNNAHTVPGQSVYVVGDHQALGEWDVRHAVKLSPDFYPQWTGIVSVPANSSLEWKCIKRDEEQPQQQLEWQPGPNNSLDTTISTHTQGSF